MYLKTSVCSCYTGLCSQYEPIVPSIKAFHGLLDYRFTRPYLLPARLYICYILFGNVMLHSIGLFLNIEEQMVNNSIHEISCYTKHMSDQNYKDKDGWDAVYVRNVHNFIFSTAVLSYWLVAGWIDGVGCNEVGLILCTAGYAMGNMYGQLIKERIGVG